MSSLATIVFLCFVANTFATNNTCFNEVCDPRSQYCDRNLQFCASCSNDCHPARLEGSVDAQNDCAVKCAGWYAETQRAEQARANLTREFNVRLRLMCNGRNCEIVARQ